MTQQKYQLSNGMRELFEEAKREPYKSINDRRGTSVDYLEQLIGVVDPFLQRFEHDVGLNGPSVWKGLRLHECDSKRPLIQLLAAHVGGAYYAHFDKEEDSARIPLENYDLWTENGKAHFHAYTMPHFAIIRPLHIDAKRHLLHLGLPDVEKKAVKMFLEEMVAQVPCYNLEPIAENFDYLHQSYMSFADVLHSLASTCFEIEAYRNDPALIKAFNTNIELPPAQIVVDTWKEAGAPFDYKLDEKSSYDRRKSFVQKNRKHIDIEQLHAECLQSAKAYVASMETIKRVYESIGNLDIEGFQAASLEFGETQKLAGIFSLTTFMEEHVQSRKKK